MNLLMDDNAKGFTLLEALIAVTILSFGMMAVTAMIDVSFSANKISRYTTRATELAAWMIDRVVMETSSPLQPYTADASRLQTFDNDASAFIRCDTAAPASPASEPGKSVCDQWKDAFRGIFRTGQAALQNASTALPEGRGILTIIPDDPLWNGNHRVTVQVDWQGATVPVTLTTVLATSD